MAAPKTVHIQSLTVSIVEQISSDEAVVSFTSKPGVANGPSIRIVVPLAAAYQYRVGQKFGLTLEEE